MTTATDTVKVACLSVGIAPDLAEAAAIAHARIITGRASQDQSAMAAKVRAAFDFTKPPTRRMSATEVCQAIGIEHPTRGEQTTMGVTLVSITQRRPMKSNGRRIYVMPAA